MNIAQQMQLAVASYQNREFDRTATLCQQILAEYPQEISAHYLLALVFQEQANWAKVIACYQQIITLQPQQFEAHSRLGAVYLALGMARAAIETLEIAVTLNPTQPSLYFNLGNAYASQEDWEQAINYYEHCIALAPSDIGAYENMGRALLHQRRWRAAAAAFRHCLHHEPDSQGAHFNLANALAALDCLAEAGQHYQRVVELNPDHAAAHFRLASTYGQRGLLTPAIAHWAIGCKHQPDDPQAQFNYAIALLLDGQLQAGFQRFEHRMSIKPPIPEWWGSPRWNGQEPLSGKHVLVYGEGGLGDQIQFVRYLPMLAKLAGKITLCCDRSLMTLFAQIPGVNRVVPRGSYNPTQDQPDYHCYLMSLPYLLWDVVGGIPSQTPYLTVPASVTCPEPLRQPCCDRRVGIVWASGTPRPWLAAAASEWDARRQAYQRRCVPLPQLIPTLTQPGIQLYSLQVGELGETLHQLGYATTIVDLSDYLTDFAATAAAIAALDLVITIDTAVAHLAGALHKPVWTLLPFVPDWRWQLKRQDSPWYPSMRLFHQPAIDDWNSVFQDVSKALAQWLSTPCY
ncbi:tetratricopeptide repeat protein [Pantanalinema sp. GBBB05]|uniref:tetratricopeptide repeat protein n=1 Tax=Pantanalinema sp. GBBB05 TaxID=2604139 RepID=UPI001E14CC58|nr:tetratricopeptide repeat protein [Pantanalinema sp. GBBB05]